MWKGVHLRKISSEYISAVKNAPHANGHFNARIEVENAKPGLEVEVELIDRETRRLVCSPRVPVKDGVAIVESQVA
ncbi:MAG: hypothetical protein H7301_09160 [Cryobacterium sp.]|nr:hypothetical protein [Oligoflexia bacterium]